MEDGLRVGLMLSMTTQAKCLNPCFNGRWSARLEEKIKNEILLVGLNPCFNGRWSASS